MTKMTSLVGNMATPSPYRSRLAPTPSGWLHLGNAFNFVLTWLLVRQSEGHLRLRIDDLDQERMRPEYVEDIFLTLEWLGLDYDAGPAGPTEAGQIRRLREYEKAVEKLRQQGRLFACTCSRADIRRLRDDHLYPGTCRKLRVAFDQTDVAWRIRVPEQTLIRWEDRFAGPQALNLAAQMGDFVIRQKNGRPAYQVASWVDDQLHGINLVVRGADLMASTAAQLFLDQEAGKGDFSKIQFLHHPLIRDPDGRKLSKSHGSIAIRNWRLEQVNSARFYQYMARMMKLGPPWPESPAELLAEFDPANFTVLAHMNSNA